MVKLAESLKSGPQVAHPSQLSTMESDDEAMDPDIWECHPFLRLYEEKENNLRLLRYHRPGVDPRIYVVRRFFGIIKGFHKVSIDYCPLCHWKE
jgi:hypothetical protein